MDIIYQITIGEIITTLILAGTAVIVWLYMRAAQKSNEIQERPILNLYLRESQIGPNISYYLKLRNVGNGPAYNIKFFGIEADEWIYYPHFKESNPILEKNGDEKDIGLWVSGTNGRTTEAYDQITGFQRFLMRLFDNAVKNNQYDEVAKSAAAFLISYEAINGKKYYSIFRIYSKITPLLRVYDLVVEFIVSGTGECDIKTAKDTCSQKPTMKKNED